MDAKFKNIGMRAVFSDMSKDGLLVQFNTEYRKKFGTNINISCPKCRASAWGDYLKLFQMEKNKSDYVLKAKYEGIQLGFGGKPMINGKFTDAEAKKLISLHPMGENLFSSIPKPKTKAKPKKTTKK